MNKQIKPGSFLIKHLCFLILLALYITAVQFYHEYKIKTFDYLGPVPYLLEFAPVLWGALSCGMFVSLKKEAGWIGYVISGVLFLLYAIVIFILSLENIWLSYPGDVKASCLVLSGASFVMAWKARKTE